MIIYKATNSISKKVYIGQTIISLKERMGDHKRKSFIHNSKTYFHYAIKKYGFDCFLWEVIDSAKSLDELNKKEEYWIKYYDSTNKKNGYNIMNGGNNKEVSKITRSKISLSQKNIKRSEEFKQKISLATKGSKNPFYGKKHSEETKKKISESRSGIKGIYSDESLKKTIHVGENNGMTKIKTQDVIIIKNMKKNGARQKDVISSMPHVTKCTIKSIWNNYSWKHINV